MNALSPALLSELREEVQSLAGDDAVDGVLLASSLDEHFSAGLDLPSFADADEKVLEAAARDFLGLFEELYGYPKPVVAALPGNAVAGGLLLPATADRRIAAAGDYKLQLNEVDLGLPVPEPEALVVRELVGLREAQRVLLDGEAYGPDEALEAGLVDDVAARDEAEDVARAQLAALAGKPAEAYRAIKRSLRAPLLDRMEEKRDEAVQEALRLFRG